MHNVFIAWGGNVSLANQIKNILQSDKFNVIVGGGSPTDMFVGAQVIDQINQCDCAILLIEDYNGQISSNLFFEWGYLLANKDIRNQNIQIFMIDKSPRELPSDLLGVWVSEMKRDKTLPDNGDAKLAEQIKAKFLSQVNSENTLDYFTIINDWPNIRQNFSDKKKRLSEREFEERVIIGCLAAYYYNDYKYLYDELSKVTGSSEFNSTILFARTYIEVFLKSDNMTKEISTKDFFKFAEIFEVFLNREITGDNFSKLVSILCNDVYGLSCLLFLKNDDLDAVVKEECKNKALKCFEETLVLTDELEKVLTENKCLLHLIRAYIYNDTAHLYEGHYNDKERYLQYLEKSVAERKNLHLTFCTKYPRNRYVANKLEQEYMIALSEKCKYMNNDFQRKISISTVKSKYDEWKADIDYISSLVRRLEHNIKALDKPDDAIKT